MGLWPPTSNKEDCVHYGLSQASLFSLVGLGAGFYQAHDTFRQLTVQQKMQRWANVVRTVRVVGSPVAYLGAVGLTFAATECVTEKLYGGPSHLSGITGGLAAGALVGIKFGVPHSIGYGLLFALGAVATDFFTVDVHNAFDGVKIYGPVEKTPVPPQA